MYSIIISIAVVLYSVILLDFSLLFKDIAVNSDVIASAQAFYTAEGVIEKSLVTAKGDDPTKRVADFLKAKKDLKITDDYFNEYNQGAVASYLNLQLGLADSDLVAAEGFNAQNDVVKEGVYLADGNALDQKSIYGLEPRSSKTFVIKEVQNQHNFSEVIFDFNKGSENSEVVFEVFSFPKEGSSIAFKKFSDLKGDAQSGPVKRLVINTKDPKFSSTNVLIDGRNFNIKVDRVFGSDYKSRIAIKGFEPIGPSGKDYILRFQALDNELIHYRLSANYNGKAVMIPNVLQTIDVIGATTNGLYQRVKFQREINEGLMPGLNFAHFTHDDIRK